MRKLVLVSAIVGSLFAASSAQAAIPSVFGGTVTCTVAGDGVRECGSTAPRSTAASWDGTPIDVNVAFPPASGSDNNYPLLIVGHGYGGSKIGFGTSGGTDGLRRFTSRGYAVFSMTDRGFHESCGSPASITAGGSACDNGYIHLMDDRYEIRDAQFFAGELEDRGPGRRPEGRCDRWLLRRWPLDATGRAQGPDDDARRQPRPVDQPGQPRSDADRRGGAGHPVERPGLLAGPERRHPRLRRRLALQRPHRDREALLSERPLPDGVHRRPLLRGGAVFLAVQRLRGGCDRLEGASRRRRAL